MGQKVFKRFTLVRVLGRGGMGVVWAAHDAELERPVALKFLPEVLAADAGALDELKRETRRALTLTHSHIVRIYDFHSEGAMAAIAMELVDGATLAMLRHDCPGKVMGAAQLDPIVRQLCEALDYAHTNARIVHRDLKPANLMVTAAGELKVTDFGISAALADSTTRLSRVAGVSGTPVYMSPQQLRGERPAVTDDLYSLGATLYELLTGKPPFFSGDIGAQVRSKVPPSVAARRAEQVQVGGSDGRAETGEGDTEPVPAEWEATIAACLAKDAAERPQSAEEVVERLGLCAGSGAARGGAVRREPPPVPPASGPDLTRGGGRARAGRVVKGIGVGALLLALLGEGYFFLIHVPADLRAAAASLSTSRPVAGGRWDIPSLGMEFVPVPGTTVLFSIWETRVKDFEAFVTATGHDATGAMYSFRGGAGGHHGATWREPGFPQGSTHPVVGVNREDGQAFCAWLTQQERTAGRLAEGQKYRLPTREEWASAFGADEFPWGSEWPPPPGAGNFADEAGKRGLFPQWQDTEYLKGYDDGYDGTAPVGLFAPNGLGIYDLAGNAAELNGGGSYADSKRGAFGSGDSSPVNRDARTGFRVVCAP